MIIGLIILLFISSYLFYCFGYNKVKQSSNNVFRYKGVNYYNIASLIPNNSDYKELKCVSFSANWYFPLWVTNIML